MAFSPKTWHNGNLGGTPIDEDALNDLEDRVDTGFEDADVAIAAEAAARADADAAEAAARAAIVTIQPRHADQILTAALAPAAEEAGAIALPRTTRFLRIVTDKAARVRIYSTAAARDADAGRAVGVDPGDNAGVIFDVVTTAALLDLRLQPQPVGSNFDGPVADQLYYRVRNDGAAGAVTVDLTTQRVE